VLPALIANDEFDSLKLWDNNGSRLVLIGRGSRPAGRGTVHDQKAWERFVAKGHPSG